MSFDAVYTQLNDTRTQLDTLDQNTSTDLFANINELLGEFNISALLGDTLNLNGICCCVFQCLLSEFSDTYVMINETAAFILDIASVFETLDELHLEVIPRVDMELDQARLRSIAAADG